MLHVSRIRDPMRLQNTSGLVPLAIKHGWAQGTVKDFKAVFNDSTSQMDSTEPGWSPFLVTTAEISSIKRALKMFENRGTSSKNMARFSPPRFMTQSSQWLVLGKTHIFQIRKIPWRWPNRCKKTGPHQPVPTNTDAYRIEGLNLPVW